MLNNYLVFNSITELKDALDNSTKLPNRGNSSEKIKGADWLDTQSWDEAYDKLINGYFYEDLADNVKLRSVVGHKSKAYSDVVGHKSKAYSDVVGYTVLTPLYLQNVPNCMVNKRKVINNKIVNIIYSPQAPSYVKSYELIEGANNLFKHIIDLETNGYRVNLYIVECNDNNFGYALKLKTDRETLNLKKLHFPLVSSSFLRRIGFRIKERLYKDWIGNGYGNGILNRTETDDFIKRKLRLRNYELWNYKGKQS